MPTARAVFIGVLSALLALSVVGAAVRARRPAMEAPAPADSGRPAPQPYTLPLAYAETVIRYCDETGAPVWLVCRLYAWESGWRRDFRSRENVNGTRDLGLAGLNSACLEAFRVYNDGAPVDPFDPECAVRVGVRYLAALHEATGSWSSAVGAYNVGLGAWRAGARPRAHIRAMMGG